MARGLGYLEGISRATRNANGATSWDTIARGLGCLEGASRATSYNTIYFDASLSTRRTIACGILCKWTIVGTCWQ